MFGQLSSASVSGTGLIVSSDGYILTNYHVIQDAYEGGYDITVLTYDGTEYTAQVVGGDEESDIAVLKIDATGLNAATLGDSDEMVVGETIYTVGNPLGELSYTMTSGIVSALDRTITTETDSNGAAVTINVFQIDAAVNSGNSGGPVYNQYGQVIGIVSAKYQATGVEGLGFAIPISDATDIANELLTNGYVSGRAYMGITCTTVSSNVAQYYNMVEGAFVNSVTSGSAADKAGLKAGDVITKIDDTDVTSSTDLTGAVKSYKAGDTAELTVYRDGNYQTISITFDEQTPTTTTSDSSSSQDQKSSQDQQSQDQQSQQETTTQEFPFDNMQDFFNYFSNYGSGSSGGYSGGTGGTGS